MVLGDGEFVRLLQERSRLVPAAQGEQRFAEQNVDDHPIGTLRAQRVEMFRRAVIVFGVKQRLGEIVPHQFVVRELFPELQSAIKAVVAHNEGTLLPSGRVQSKFYSPGDQRAENVQCLFATIARRYDLLNDLMSAGLHRHWKRRLVKMAGQPRNVLDLCCGTGDLALRFQARVVGADFTAEMLRVAETRSREIEWLQADALHLPFPDNSFDVVSVGYGLRNLADINAGLREIYRVLRPGGKFLSLDFGKPAWSVWRGVYFWYLRTFVPALGRLFCGDADTHAYILASLDDYPAQRGIRQQMETIGFTDCGFVEFVGGAMAINYGCKPPL